MVRVLVRIFLAVSLLTYAVFTASAETRLALLIGNQNYAANVGLLKNPRQDVALIEASLSALGFKVTILNDADYRSMDVALKRYSAELRRAGPGALGFFYYSGHGAANAETQINYLIPVDVASAGDETLWYQSFQQNQIIDLLSKQATNATQFVVFDACRNELNLPGGAAKAIGADKGFVPVAPTAGLLIAYATAPNRTASDAGEGGGAYAKVLAEELLKPGVEAVTMFRNVQIRVKQAIGQDPWLSFPSLEPVYLAGREATPPTQPVLKEQIARPEELRNRPNLQFEQGTALRPQSPPASPECNRRNGDYVVIDVKWDDPDGGLVISSGPGMNAGRVGVIPAAGGGIGIFGCLGIWCRVKYGCHEGWSSKLFLAERSERQYRVVGVQPADPEGLAVRSGPGFRYSQKGSIRFNATEVVKHTCQPSPNDRTDWCLVSWQELSGWVAGRFLAP